MHYGIEINRDTFQSFCLHYIVGFVRNDVWLSLTMFLLFILAIQHKYDDWKDFLVKRLTGARTLPHNFYSKVQDCVRDIPLKKSMRVEVVDKMCVSAMKVARVEEVVGGRVRLQYTESKVSYTLKPLYCYRDPTKCSPHA